MPRCQAAPAGAHTSSSSAPAIAAPTVGRCREKGITPSGRRSVEFLEATTCADGPNVAYDARTLRRNGKRRAWQGDSMGRDNFTVRNAVRNNWQLIPIPVVALVAVAAVLAFMRTPTYIAESQLTLGQLDVAAQAPSYVTAAQGLAATYARAIHAGPVTHGAAKALHITPLEASMRLQASPVPNTPLFLIDAKGS